MNFLKSLFFVALTGLVLNPTIGSSAILQYDQYQKLKGAIGINVNGDYYDVEFFDDTPENIYKVNNLWDFTFDSTNAYAAHRALWNQVFDGSYFADAPEDVYGIESELAGIIYTPYQGTYDQFATIWYQELTIRNLGVPYYDSSVHNASTNLSELTGNIVYSGTYARWTPNPDYIETNTIPEPSTIILFFFGILSITGMNRLRVT